MKYTLRSIAILAVVVLFTACKKEWNELGSQLIVSDDLEIFSFDDQEIKISVVKEDSLITLNRPTSFVGSIQDPYFGNTTASLYTEFRIPSTDVDFGSSAQADSIVLYLDIAGYYGDTLSPLSISVREMLETIETTTTDSLDVESSVDIYSTDDFAFEAQLLNEPEQAMQPIVNSELKVTLSNTFAQHFLDADSANYADNDAFQNFFNGLYVTAGHGVNDGLLLELDLLNENSKPDTNDWHKDFTFKSNPPFASILHGVSVPKVGGDTLWASMSAAYESLPEGWKEDLEGLEAIHDMGTFRNDFYREGGVDSVNSALKKVGSAVHKVVDTHPISGLKYLNVNQSFTRNIVNESQGSSDHILQFLFKHMAKPEFQVRFYWQNNSVAIWDNRITQHYAVNDYLPNIRHMQRVTIINDKRVKLKTLKKNVV